ncbi:hypothetical protein DVB69_10965 [Sporosarcina sp. BI001-red]|nr:hypothetical protein DVB69_10965 [Sporosarcina sp. BI001-red]
MKQVGLKLDADQKLCNCEFNSFITFSKRRQFRHKDLLSFQSNRGVNRTRLFMNRDKWLEFSLKVKAPLITKDACV